MTLYYSLFAECGTFREDAEKFRDFFANRSISGVIPEYNGEDLDGQKTYYVWLTAPHIDNEIDLEAAKVYSEFGIKMYTLLLDAPKFRFAIVDLEVDSDHLLADFIGTEEKEKLTENPNFHLWPGLVMDKNLAKHHIPSTARNLKPFGKNYLWEPYQGAGYLEGDADGWTWFMNSADKKAQDLQTEITRLWRLASKI